MRENATKLPFENMREKENKRQSDFLDATSNFVWLLDFICCVFTIFYFENSISIVISGWASEEEEARMRERESAPARSHDSVC